MNTIQKNLYLYTTFRSKKCICLFFIQRVDEEKRANTEKTNNKDNAGTSEIDEVDRANAGNN